MKQVCEYKTNTHSDADYRFQWFVHCCTNQYASQSINTTAFMGRYRHWRCEPSDSCLHWWITAAGRGDRYIDGWSLMVLLMWYYTFNILSIDLADCCSGFRNPSNMSIDRNSTLQVRVISGEHAYAGISSSLLVTDRNIHWPQCTLILPYTVPLIGKNITLYGMIIEYCFHKTDVWKQPTICYPTSLLVLNSSSTVSMWNLRVHLCCDVKSHLLYLLVDTWVRKWVVFIWMFQWRTLMEDTRICMNRSSPPMTVLMKARISLFVYSMTVSNRILW